MNTSPHLYHDYMHLNFNLMSKSQLISMHMGSDQGVELPLRKGNKVWRVTSSRLCLSHNPDILHCLVGELYNLDSQG